MSNTRNLYIAIIILIVIIAAVWVISSPTGTRYRLLTDGARYKIQFKEWVFSWTDYKELGDEFGQLETRYFYHEHEARMAVEKFREAEREEQRLKERTWRVLQ